MARRAFKNYELQAKTGDRYDNEETRVLCIAAVTGFALCGCVTPRWQVYQSEYSYDAEGEKESKYSTRNTILVDSKTGKTWILSPSDEGDEADYYWIEMRKK